MTEPKRAYKELKGLIEDSDKKSGIPSSFTHRVVPSSAYGVINGIFSIAMPSVAKPMESKKPIGPGPVIDLAVDFIALNLLRDGNVQAALIAKVGYNTFVQIAPDVEGLLGKKLSKS